jgi:hypothetical protein
MTEKQPSCKQRVRAEYRHEIAKVRRLWGSYKIDPETYTDDGIWTEYGLSFDYVAPGTFEGQKRGYFRYQISWGGPSDEFRFFVDEQLHITSVQYWFMDWFDGAKVIVNGKDRELLEEIWQEWLGCELPQSKMKEATQD